MSLAAVVAGPQRWWCCVVLRDAVWRCHGVALRGLALCERRWWSARSVGDGRVPSVVLVVVVSRCVEMVVGARAQLGGGWFAVSAGRVPSVVLVVVVVVNVARCGAVFVLVVVIAVSVAVLKIVVVVVVVVRWFRRDRGGLVLALLCSWSWCWRARDRGAGARL